MSNIRHDLWKDGKCVQEWIHTPDIIIQGTQTILRALQFCCSNKKLVIWVILLQSDLE